ncbi:MAG: hypothetical protein MSC30_18405 [Gaiellaceae bacterium MAG52_C11]|nr:hypothetical protein [Candidatus Gaiellasilicea maunaloa]
MAGVDTVRGIAFQHAYAIHLALDAIDDQDTTSLTIEGSADVVDVELARRIAPSRPIVQIKSRQEPYNWPPERRRRDNSRVAGGGRGRRCAAPVR